MFSLYKLARLTLASTLLAGVAGQALAAEPAPMARDVAAKIFGSRPAVTQMSIAPDGKHIAYVGAAAGQATALVVGDMATGELKVVNYTDGKPLNLVNCDWSSNDRLVCQSYGLDIAYGKRLSYTRLVGLDLDGKNQRSLAAPMASGSAGLNQYDGEVIDWLGHKDGKVLIARNYVAGPSTGHMGGPGPEGIAVDLVDSRTGVGRTVERARKNADTYLTDGRGNVRIMGILRTDASGEQLTGEEVYEYRQRPEAAWQPFSVVDNKGKGTVPVAVDPVLNAAYVLKDRAGRKALFRVALDGSMKEELVLDNPRVDVDTIELINDRVIGGAYDDERKTIVYFDPEYRKLAEGLGRALPNSPLIDFEAATPDEKILLIRASSDTDEGRFYAYNKDTHALQQLMSVRPAAEGHVMATVQPITYKSFDGTDIPAYLTLPPGSSGKNLPAIVMPHGGPASRDVWGFDWLAQFFAARGYAVIQPEFRGSTGYGESWFLDNGFKSWKTSIGDVNAAGRWLITKGIADPSKLGIFGWSYGGYAALQSNVLDPALFKAVVAVAPVTDLYMLRHEREGLTNEEINKKYIGTAELAEASPDRHAAAFKAPVLMFHGTTDINVGFAESEAMNSALRSAGKQSELVRYPGLDHQLSDSSIRADLLSKADVFLHKTMGIAE